jgi:CubicO group peptidase (beta-lactamase class C family)
VRRRPLEIAVACGLVVMLSGCVPGPGTVPRSSLADGIAQSEDLFLRLLAADEPGCSGAVAINGEIVWSGARGVVDLETGKPVTTTTIFDIASVAKQFTATAILLLAQDGRLGLGDAISDYIDGMPEWADDVTI